MVELLKPKQPIDSRKQPIDSRKQPIVCFGTITKKTILSLTELEMI